MPATTGKGAGSASLSYDTATKMLSFKVTYSGLTGPATMGHIHGPAEIGKNAPVAIAFASPASPIEGSATLTDAQAADLLAGKMYVNVHTAENKGGEIRGQIVQKLIKKRGGHDRAGRLSLEAVAAAGRGYRRR